MFSVWNTFRHKPTVCIPEVILKNKDGQPVNYGCLALVTLKNGKLIVTNKTTIERHGYTYEVPEVFPDFVSDFSIVVEASDQYIDQDTYYVLKREDLLQLAVWFSRRNHYVRIEHRQRFLKQWTDSATEPAKTLDQFFPKLSKEEIDHSRLE